MPRDTAGNYTLPAGNPVASGEIISASWANSTMNDLGQSLSASLDRYGRGGMLAPFQFTDGTESAPGATWSNEPTTGLYRAAYGDLRFTLTGTDVQRWTSANAYLWRNSQWEEILTQTGGGGDTTINNLVVTGSFTSPGIDDNATATALWINSSNNVGIGRDTPSEKLDVMTEGNSDLGPISIALGGPSTNNRRCRWTKDTTTRDMEFYAAAGASTSNTVFYRNDTDESMRLDSSGRVGIGTSDPSAGTSDYYNDLVIKNTGVGAGITIQAQDSTGYGGIDFRDASGGQIGKLFAELSTGSLGLETGGVSRVNIDSTGNVGIGDIPKNNLDVVGATGIYQRHSSGGRIVLDDVDTADASKPMSFILSTI